jgi:hypothetical protein
VNDAAKVTISLINRRSGQVTRLGIFCLQPDLALRLVEQIETVLAGLTPGRISLSRSVTTKGATVIDINLKPVTQREAAQPKLTFEQLYRRSEPNFFKGDD